jgi:hypothetical protein
MGRDGLTAGVVRVLPDHRSSLGKRVSRYMRALVASHLEAVEPLGVFSLEGVGNGHAAPTLSVIVKERVRLAGRLLVEEEQLVVEMERPSHEPLARRRLERRLLRARSMRLKVETLLAESLRRKQRW